MRRNRLRTIALTGAIVALTYAAAADAAPCLVNAVAALRQAHDNGFGFEVVSSTATRCKLVQSTLVVAAPSAKPAECKFAFLTGRALAPGWKLIRFQISGDADMAQMPMSVPATDEAARTPASALIAPGRILQVRVPAGQTVTLSIKRIVIEGAPCDDALKAFD